MTKIAMSALFAATLFFTFPTPASAGSTYSPYSLQANVSGIINTLSLKVYCGISNLFSKSCEVDLSASMDYETPVQRDPVLKIVESEINTVVPSTVSKPVRETVVERVVEYVSSPVRSIGITADFFESRLAELAAQLRSEMTDRTVTVKTSSGSSSDSFSRQVDSIYDDMSESVSEAIEGLQTEDQVLALIAANATELPVGTAGYVLQTTGTTTQWVATSTLGFATAGSDWIGTLDGQVSSFYLARASHTGTQAASTISDFSSTARGLFSSSATGLTYTSGTGAFSLTSGYEIPITASTTEWTSKVSSQWATGGSNISYTGGNVGIGTTTSTAKLDVFSTTEQLRLGYNSSNYLSMTVMSDGEVVLDSVGTDAEFSFSDNVGIKTTNPLADLDIYGSSGGSADLDLMRNDSTTVLDDQLGTLNFGSTDGPSRDSASISVYAAENHSASSAGSYMTFMTTPVGTDVALERMRISSTGNVGIGSSTPSSKLTVNGGLFADSIASTNWSINSGGYFDGTAEWAYYGGNSGNVLAVASAGYVYDDNAIPLSAQYADAAGTATLANGANANLGPFFAANSFLLDADNSPITSISLGSASIPSISFTSDANTGVWSPAADTLAFSTAGSERLRVTSAGNVGIGTDAPAAKLVVNGTVSTGDLQVGVSVNNTASNGYSVFRIGTAAAAAVGLGIHQFNLTYNGTGAYTALSSTFSAFESGGLKLHANNAAGTIRFYTAGSAAANERMVIDASGNVAIGATTATEKFNVIGSVSGSGKVATYIRNTSSAGYSELVFDNDSTTTGGAFVFGYGGSGTANPNEAYFYQRRNANLLFGTNNATRLVITGGGNVGIGTTTPSAKLAITGTAGTGDIFTVASSTNARLFSISSSGEAYLQNASGALIIGDGIGNARGSQALDIQSLHASATTVASGARAVAVGYGNTASASDSVSVGNSNIVSGINATAFGYLNTASASTVTAMGYGNTATVSSSVAMGLSNNATANGAVAIGIGVSNSIAGSLQIGSSNTAKIAILSSGNVGIGNTSPGEKLELTGNLLIKSTSSDGWIKGYDDNHGIRFRVGGANETRYYSFGGELASNLGHRFYTGGLLGSQTEKMRISDDGVYIVGNVGIGTTTPSTILSLGSGQLSVATGTVALPSYTFNGDLDTGIYSTAANTLNFSAGGVSQLTIGGTNIYTGNGGRFSTGAGTVASPSFGYVGAGGLGLYYPTTTSLALVTNTVERLRIDSSGNVGIGTTTPGAKLHIPSDSAKTAELIIGDDVNVLPGSTGYTIATIMDADNVPGLLVGKDATHNLLFNWTGSASTGYGVLETYGGTNSLVLQSSGGNVGIGTSTPQRRLHVYTAADEAPVRFEDANGFCEINPTSTTWSCTSDERLKDNITDLADEDVLERMSQLRPVNFSWKSDDSDTQRAGLIAQEVERIFPELVNTDERGYKSVSYGGFTIYFISAIRQLTEKLESIAVWFGEGRFNVSGDVCVDDVCVTKEEFKNLLRNGANVNEVFDNSQDSGDSQPPEETPGNVPADVPNETPTDTPTDPVPVDPGTGSGSGGGGDTTPPTGEPTPDNTGDGSVGVSTDTPESSGSSESGWAPARDSSSAGSSEGGGESASGTGDTSSGGESSGGDSGGASEPSGGGDSGSSVGTI